MEDRAAWVIVAVLLGAMGFMLRQYFLRVEKHMGWSHRIRGAFAEVHMRLARLEQRLFPNDPGMPPPKLDDKDEDPER